MELQPSSVSSTGAEPRSSPSPTSKADSPTKRKRTAECQAALANMAKPRVASFDIFPPEIWQHIFSFVAPSQLGKLLQVDRAFNASLTDPDFPQRLPSIPVTAVKLQEPESIWATSRRSFHPAIPRPLAQCSELDTWKLLKGKRCQFCGRNRTKVKPASSPWERGPGEGGVRVIWPFSVLSCGSCLRLHSQSEASLLFTSASALLPALPFAFVTENMHMVPALALKPPAAIPPNIQISKIFFSRHVEKLQLEVEDIRGLGKAAGEEWFKGLQDQGKQKLNDLTRWERWEHEGGFERMHSVPNSPNGRAAPHFRTKSTIPTPVQSWFNRPPGTQRTLATDAVPLQTNLSSAPYPVSRPSSVSVPYSQFPQPRSERVLQDVNDMKAARRAEIERRCLELDPPISANILQHMDSFKAATQIATVFNDAAWDMLKPRILAQREVAEFYEKERLTDQTVQQAKFEERRAQEATTRATLEAADREWEDAQAPIREKLVEYADELISNTWADGKNINAESCPQFAAEILMYVRKRFYSDLAKEDAATVDAGREIEADSGTGPPMRMLTLENMKWIYEAKIRPLTEGFRKDLFLCNGCDNILKYYAFDGVIQHYAAKHTNTFSVGHSSVHWKTAEWPEQPPFVPDPSGKKVELLTMYTSGQQFPIQAANQGQIFTHVPTPIPGSRSQAVHSLVMSPGPYGNLPQYSAMVQGPYAPPSSFYGQPSPSFGYHPGIQQSFSPPFKDQGRFNPPHYSGYPTPLQGQQAFQGHPVVTPNQSKGSWTTPNTGTFQSSSGSSSNYQPFYHNQTLDHSSASALVTSGSSTVNLYQSQIEHVAFVAQDVWQRTTGIKGMPPSVRIYVIIHHVVFQFKFRFKNEPNLDLFSDTLLNHQLMRPIRFADGLACKTCIVHGSDSVETHAPSFHLGERKLYALHALFDHFKTHHIEHHSSFKGLNAPRLDWKEDMIELPDDSLIVGLTNAPGMDRNKLEMLADVFPNLLSGFVQDHEYRTPHGHLDSKETVHPDSGMSPSHMDQSESRIRHQNQSADVLSRSKYDLPNSAKPLYDLIGSNRDIRPVSASSRGPATPAKGVHGPHQPDFAVSGAQLEFGQKKPRSSGPTPDINGTSPAQRPQPGPSRQVRYDTFRSVASSPDTNNRQQESRASHISQQRVSGRSSIIQSPPPSCDVMQEPRVVKHATSFAQDDAGSEEGELGADWEQRGVIRDSRMSIQPKRVPSSASQVSPVEQADRFLDELNTADDHSGWNMDARYSRRPDRDMGDQRYAKIRRVEGRYSPEDRRPTYHPIDDGFIALDDDDPYARRPIMLSSGRGPSRVSDRPSYVKVQELPPDYRYYDRTTDEPVQFIRIDRGINARYREPERFLDGDYEYIPLARATSRQPRRDEFTNDHDHMSRTASRQPPHEEDEYEYDQRDERVPLGEPRTSSAMRY